MAHNYKTVHFMKKYHLNDLYLNPFLPIWTSFQLFLSTALRYFLVKTLKFVYSRKYDISEISEKMPITR